MTKICRFFRPPGLGNIECEASVNYAELQQRLCLKPLAMVSLCMGRTQGCSSYQSYTPEEIAAQEEEQRQARENEDKTVKAIRDKTKGKRGQHGTINCLACPVGTVVFGTAEHNGHISAKCSTPGCISFRE